MVETLLMCAALLAPYANAPNLKGRLTTCVKVATTAQEHGLDPKTMIALGWVESGMLATAVSRAGAVGPMQVLPRYCCPNKKARGCDLIAAGMRAFKRWRKHYKPIRETLCHYNAGWKCGGRSKAYARAVLRERARLLRRLREFKKTWAFIYLFNLI